MDYSFLSDLTQDQKIKLLNDLDRAIASGAASYKMEDREVVFRSLNQMLSTRRWLSKRLGVQKRQVTNYTPIYTMGDE